jgi:hypothetical protein
MNGTLVGRLPSACLTDQASPSSRFSRCNLYLLRIIHFGGYELTSLVPSTTRLPYHVSGTQNCPSSIHPVPMLSPSHSRGSRPQRLVTTSTLRMTGFSTTTAPRGSVYCWARTESTYREACPSWSIRGLRRCVAAIRCLDSIARERQPRDCPNCH